MFGFFNFFSKKKVPQPQEFIEDRGDEVTQYMKKKSNEAIFTDAIDFGDFEAVILSKQVPGFVFGETITLCGENTIGSTYNKFTVTRKLKDGVFIMESDGTEIKIKV